jgi:hypothetical protein
MWFPWKRSPTAKLSPSAIGARCPTCKRELPLFYDQADLFAAGHRVWVFCPVCERLVSPLRFERPQTPPVSSARVAPGSGASSRALPQTA